jgi:hypothetical protein
VRPQRVETIAARLSAALGTHIRRLGSPSGVRLEADLPPDLPETKRRDLLAAIADADAYGHEHTGRSNFVWVFINSQEDS